MEQQKIPIMYTIFCYKCPTPIVVEACNKEQALKKFVDYINDHREDYEPILESVNSQLKYLTVKALNSKNSYANAFEVEDPVCTKEWFKAAINSGAEPKVWVTDFGLRMAEFVVKKNTVIL